jgi:hypothetical protein
MKNIILFSIFILACFITYGQNLIGYNGKEIQKYMKENRKDLSSEKVTNNFFKYLKYSDSSDSQTLLFFLNHDSVCKSVRMICNFSAKAEKVKEFNSMYNKSGENRWIDTRAGKDYLIEIKDERWSCIVTIVPDK